jgi:hypothetical protein
MNKLVLLIILGFTTFFSFGQSLSIDPIIKDSININENKYHVSGLVEFCLDCVLKIELFDVNEEENILFSGEYLMNEKTTKNLTNFLYNSEDMSFSFDIGIFENPNLYIHLWMENSEGKVNEIYYKQ